MKLPTAIQVNEVGPRDGLQNEKVILTTAQKCSMIQQLTDAGTTYVEVASFVHPKWMPPLADGMDVLKQLQRKNGVTYAALVPNMKGLERALEANVDEVSVFFSASEAHNQANLNRSIEETLPIIKEVVEEALRAGKTVRGYLSTVIACPYAGYIEPSITKKYTEFLLECGVREVSLGETIGVAVPSQVEALLDELTSTIRPEQLAMHFHDTYGMAIANIVASFPYGITTFDSSVGGVGGCPYAKGAAGNVSTEDVLYLCEKMNISTGIDREKIVDVSEWLAIQLQRTLPSKQLQIRKGAH